VSIALAVILLGAASAAIVLGILGENAWAAVAGGVTMADLLGVLIYKPLAAINRSLVATQRIDIVHLAARERLRAIPDIQNPEKRVAAAKSVWEEIKADLQGLAAADPQ